MGQRRLRLYLFPLHVDFNHGLAKAGWQCIRVGEPIPPLGGFLLISSRHLKPGGWAEFQDYDLLYYSEDGSLTEEHHVLKWIKLFIDAANKKLNREPCPGPKLNGWVTDAGFTNIVHRKFRLPLGPWPKDPHMKDIGMCNVAQVLEGLEAFSLKLFCGVLGMSTEEVHVMLAGVRNELHSRKYHAQLDL